MKEERESDFMEAITAAHDNQVIKDGNEGVSAKQINYDPESEVAQRRQAVIKKRLDQVAEMERLRQDLAAKDAAVKVLMEENAGLHKEVADCDEQIKEGIARKVKAISKFADEHRAAVKVLVEENAELRKGLADIANYHADKYELACKMSQETWVGVEHDQWVAKRRMNERQWKRAARMILGDEYDSTASPHHFPKHEEELS